MWLTSVSPLDRRGTLDPSDAQVGRVPRDRQDRQARPQAQEPQDPQEPPERLGPQDRRD